MKIIKFSEFLNESIINNWTYKDTVDFVDKLKGKTVSFYQFNKEYIELIEDVELSADLHVIEDNTPWYGDIWFNGKLVNLTKEIKIIE